jgi:hypothetical protein
MMRGMIMQLHFLAKERGLGNSTLEAMAARQFGKKELRALTVDEYDFLFASLSAREAEYDR